MDGDREAAILRMAAERGLILDAGPDTEPLRGPAPPGAGSWGPRIERLVRQGRLEARIVEALAAELERQPTRRLFGTSPLDSGPASLPARSDPRAAWPVADWDRFEFVAFLGEGGMGRVYKGFDRRLGRPVAVKFLRGNDPEHAERFLGEARAQARVEHDHVCKIYEVGEARGHLYIAMQFVAGETLTDAGLRMTLEERVRAIQQVAEGVHAAHRIGLIHRDIKPANVMVERTADGAWRPYVLDFGLAREIEAPGLTQTGFIVGTPAFLAPEQARAERLDRRTDVHALGATLYCLLSGRPPYGGDTAFEVLQQVVGAEPVPLRRLDPSIPVDLDTIVMKCLEKDPGRRYDSARALAEDLGRYLDGEPVQARAPSLTYRLAKRARKHRLAVAAGGLAAAGVLLFAGMAVRIELRARQEARLASVFGQEVQFAEEALRRAYTAPLHDTGPEKAAVRQRLDELARQVEDAGPAGVGPGHHAIGRILLDLGEPRAARAHLEKAWRSGYQLPEVAYALGRTLGEIYEMELEEARRLETGPQLAARKREIDSVFRGTILSFLEASRGVRVDSPEYVQALIAWFGGRPREALRRAAEAQRKLPWLYEASLLEGEVLANLATRARERGDRDGALRTFRRAHEAFARAAAIGPSDPRGYEGLARVWIVVMDTLLRARQDPEPLPARIEEAARKALAAEPRRASVHRRLANARKLQAEFQMARGQDPEPALQAAAEAALAAVRLDPESAEGHFDLGLVSLQRARYQAQRGRDPRDALELAVQSFNAVLAAYPNLAAAHQNLASAYREGAQAAMAMGLDPVAPLEKAALHLGKAAELRPEDALPHLGLGNLHWRFATHQVRRGGEPGAHFDRAIAAYGEALRRSPGFATADHALGDAYLDLARYRIGRGEDPKEALRRAAACYQRAIAGKPGEPGPYRKLGTLFRMLARNRMDHGDDPRQLLRQAEEAYRKAIQASPRFAQAHAELALVHALRALYEARQGRDSEGELARAVAAARTAQRLDPRRAEVWADAGEVEMARAACALLHGRSPAPYFERAAVALERALDPRRGFENAFLTKAELYRRRAEWRAAQGLATGEEVEKGLEAVGHGLALNPRWAEALAVRGVLELQAARAAAEPGLRSAAARRALDAFERALQINRSLRREYGSYLEQAQGLLLPVSLALRVAAWRALGAG